MSTQYDASRDPRLFRQPSNVQMTDSLPIGPLESAEPPLPETRAQLLTRIADQASEVAKLQFEKLAVKDKLRDTHTRLTSATTSLTTLTLSYAKRLEEKNAFMAENTVIERTMTTLRDDIAKLHRTIARLEIENESVQDQVTMLQTEREILQRTVVGREAEKEQLQREVQCLETDKEKLYRRIQELEAEQEQRSSPVDAVQEIWGHGQGLVRPVGGGDSYTPRYDNEDRRGNDRRGGGGGDGGYGRDNYRPGGRDERTRSRAERF